MPYLVNIIRLLWYCFCNYCIIVFSDEKLYYSLKKRSMQRKRA